MDLALSGVICSTITYEDFLNRVQLPFLEKAVVLSISFNGVKGGLNSFEHGWIVLTHANTFRALIDHRATDFKATRIEFDIVVGDRGVLIGGNDALVDQQLYDIGLVFQGSDVNSFTV